VAGIIADAKEAAQFAELEALGDLTRVGLTHGDQEMTRDVRPSPRARRGSAKP